MVSLRKNNTPTATISLRCNKLSNENIEKQRRFYSTEKKRKEKKVRLTNATSDEKDELFRSRYDWLDKLETNISKVIAEDSPLLSMVSGVSYDSMKNIISYKRKNLSSCGNVPKKKQRQTQIAKYQLLCHQTKVNSISQNYKKIPCYNGKLNAGSIRILNERYSFFLPVLAWTEHKFLYIVLS